MKTCKVLAEELWHENFFDTRQECISALENAIREAREETISLSEFEAYKQKTKQAIENIMEEMDTDFKLESEKRHRTNTEIIITDNYHAGQLSFYLKLKAKLEL